MDTLEPIDSSEKVIINHGLDIVDEQSMESDDEQRVVDHLSPQTLLETPGDTEVQYSFRSAEGTITYGVLKVEDTNDVQQIVTTGGNFANSGVQQVLTGNLNGPLYVIGNPNEVFVSQPGTRAIAPRSSIIEAATSVTTNIKKRDERRRATHNEVERRRRDKINNWITKLSKIIPESSSSEMKGNGHYDGQSKGGILAKACEYIMELRDCKQNLDLYVKENKQLSEHIHLLKQKNFELEKENAALLETLKKHGIGPVEITLS